ncbi:MAG: substrate-binding domain-containing protein [Fibrobacterota bacterium]|nr:substrate-binding domain-containing protein [Fibrobacterota bacterium]QQS04679.1 MAG: substrate-binding domain-containing protein [Fibrobacterota bacterium]
MKSRIVGVLLLVAMIAGAVWYKFARGNTGSLASGPVRTIQGIVGGEKTSFLEDTLVKEILVQRYGIVIQYTKAGSIEMARGPIQGVDFLWPSSQTALEIFRERNATAILRSEVIFNSPLVLYSWDSIATALEKQGILRGKEGVWFVKDFPKLADQVVAGKKWKDVGVSGLFGKVNIVTTDPVLSNSGYMFAGLVANVLHGDVMEDAEVDTVLPRVRRLFRSLGYMERSSSDLFQQYMNTGIGAKPLVAGYESQMLEFAALNAQAWVGLRKRVRIFYPEPTVWSAHPLVALSPTGKQLVTAMLDPEIQKIAWERHGFRSGVAGIVNDPAAIPVDGLPSQIQQVVPMPSARTMDRILSAISAP